jgi:polyhydroxybutyrate depolymerase
MAIAACTGPVAAGHPSQGQSLSGPAARSLLPFPGRLVDQPVSSSDCGHQGSVRPGTTAQLTVAVPPSSAAGARTRDYWLHVPADYTPSRRMPLVLAFHGGGGTGLGMEHSTGLSAVADRQGFLVAYPQGLRQDHGRAPPGWDASGPRDPFADGIDDGLYVSDVLNALQAGYCVNPARIAATGISNGGSMAGYLACVLAGRIAGFAPVEGVFFQIPGGCHPSRPAAILDVHVLTDPVAPYAGVPSRGSPDYYALAIPAWLRGWAFRDGCTGSSHPLNGSAMIAGEPRTAIVTGEQWADCPAGVTVVGVRLASGGHSWFQAIGAPAGDEMILRFFAAHPLRAALGSWSPRPGAPAPSLIAPELAVHSIRQFRLTTPGAEPFDIAAGPDGSMWFTEFHADKIGRISPSGVITEFRVPTAGVGPYQIAAGPDHSMWFTEYNTTKIGQVSSTGRITEIQMPQPTYGGTGITGSPAGPVWIADPGGFIDTISPAGTVTRIRLPATGIPFAIAQSPFGHIWVSELTGYFEYSRVLLHLHPASGEPVSTLTLGSTMSDIDALAAGPGATVWFADFGTSQIGEINGDGRVRLFADMAPYSGLSDIAEGPDSTMWFSEQAGFIGRIDKTGALAELALPSQETNPDGVAAGLGHTIWVTETGSNAIARIQLPT